LKTPLGQAPRRAETCDARSDDYNLLGHCSHFPSKAVSRDER
jgi:hypothetical protein